MIDWLRQVRVRLLAAFCRREPEAELAEERRVQREWENRTPGTARDFRWLEQLAQDFRHGARGLRRTPAFTLLAILTLALGFAATAAMLAVMRAVVFQPLPYAKAERLVRVSERIGAATGLSIAYPNFEDWQAQQNVFAEFGLYRETTWVLAGGGSADEIPATQISMGALAALGVRPVMGRLIAPDEDRPAGPPVALLGHSLWQTRFGGDPGIIGQTITLSAQPLTVIGVMPPGFAFPRMAKIWTPLGAALSPMQRQRRSEHPNLGGVARLRPDLPLEQARRQLGDIAGQLEIQHPATNRGRSVHVESWRAALIGSAGGAVWMLFAAVGLMLLVACANVANLLLARAGTRRREISLRLALGASRWRIGRQLLIESLLLATAGGALGLGTAVSVLGVAGRILHVSIPAAGELTLGGAVPWSFAAIVLLMGVVFGLAPAWDARRVDLHTALKSGTPGIAAGSGSPLQGAIIVGQVAVTLVLLYGTGLLLHSFRAIQAVDPGFAPERVLSVRLNLPSWKYPADRRAAFFTELTERLRVLPGVHAVSVSSKVPLDATGGSTRYAIPGQPAPDVDENWLTELALVGPDYFRVLGIPLLKGRVFREGDARPSPGAATSANSTVAVIDHEFARRHWPDRDPIGERIALGNGTEATVIGVVGRVKSESLTGASRTPQAYVPFWHQSRANMAIVVQAALPAETTAAMVRGQVRAMDPEQPLQPFQTVAELYAKSSAPQRLSFTLLGSFAAVALTLAAVGLYGVTAYAVAQRQREIGIRIALGAQAGGVIRLLLGEGMRLVGIGAVIGILAAFSFGQALRGFLFGVTLGDPFNLAAVIALFALVAALACWLPARRAARVDPMIALRAE